MIFPVKNWKILLKNCMIISQEHARKKKLDLCFFLKKKNLRSCQKKRMPCWKWMFVWKGNLTCLVASVPWEKMAKEIKNLNSTTRKKDASLKINIGLKKLPHLLSFISKSSVPSENLHVLFDQVHTRKRYPKPPLRKLKIHVWKKWLEIWSHEKKNFFVKVSLVSKSSSAFVYNTNISSICHLIWLKVMII